MEQDALHKSTPRQSATGMSGRNHFDKQEFTEDKYKQLGLYEKRPKPLHSFFLFHLQSFKNAVTGFHQPLVVEDAYDTQCDDSED